MNDVENEALARFVATPEARALFRGPLCVEDVMSIAPINLAPDRNFYDVVSLMAKRSVHHALVVDDEDRLYGVISDRDVLRALSKSPDWSNKCVRDVMTSDPVTVAPETPISTAAQLLIAKRINCLPVMDTEHRVCGILTSVDLLKAYEKLQALIEKAVK